MSSIGKVLVRLRLPCLIIFLGVLMSLFSTGAFASDSKATVYDDNGKPITEEEIRAYMISDYKPGCCLLGGVIGSAASLLLGCAAGSYVSEHGTEDDASGVLGAIWVTGTVASAFAGHKAGEEIDRRKAIELIKEERRIGRKPPLPRREFLPKVGGCLVGVCLGGGCLIEVGALILLGIVGD
ncbi:hypothetical protein FJZ31_16735 [Candidatus Poribacteria bacterium]|nr:hypothetical protein [Candidatus Poribacteria bacterium]